MDSIWRMSFPQREFPPLKGTIDTDVCIVGAGIAGLLTAYRLLEHGRKVVVVERDQPGSGETLNTTAHISFILDRRLHELEELHGKESTRLAVQSHGHAIQWLNEVAQGGANDCAFEYLDGYLFGEFESLQAELEMLQLAGMNDAALIAPPLKSFSGQTCLRVPQQAQFHPGLFVQGLTREIMRRGGAI